MNSVSIIISFQRQFIFPQNCTVIAFNLNVKFKIKYHHCIKTMCKHCFQFLLG